MSAVGPLRRVAAVLTSLPGRILISGALLALVANSVDWDTVGTTLSNARWGWMVGSVAAVAAALAFGAVRWHLLLAGAGVSVTLRQSFGAYAAGAFSNNLLPTGFGGDVVRGWLIAGLGNPFVRALTSVFVDRVTALACFLVLAWIAVAADAQSIPFSLVALLGGATLLLCLAGLLIAAMLRRERGLRMLPSSVQPWAVEVLEVLRVYAHNRNLQLRAALLGVIFQALMVGAAWELSEALDLGLGPAVLAVVTPLVLIATIAPISIAGLGVREGAFVVLLAEVGTPAADAILLALLSAAVMTVASLPGGIALALWGRRAQHDQAPM